MKTSKKQATSTFGTAFTATLSICGLAVVSFILYWLVRQVADSPDLALADTKNRRYFWNTSEGAAAAVKSWYFREYLEKNGATQIFISAEKLSFWQGSHEFLVSITSEGNTKAAILAVRVGHLIYETDPSFLTDGEDIVTDAGGSGFACDWQTFLWLRHLVSDGVNFEKRDPFLAGNSAPDHKVYQDKVLISRVVSGEELVATGNVNPNVPVFSNAK